MKILQVIVFLLLLLATKALLAQSMAEGDSVDQPINANLPIDDVPDLRDVDLKVKVEDKDRDWFVVPIPMSSPTFGTGLILGGAYFYPQTEEEKKSQPASFTGAAAAYTTNKSWFAGAMHQSYFKEDRW